MIRYRLSMVVAGLFVAALGVTNLRNGVFAFKNVGYHQTVFSAGVIATGILLALLACIPTGDWLYRRITTKRRTPQQMQSRRSRRSKSADFTK